MSNEQKSPKDKALNKMFDWSAAAGACFGGAAFNVCNRLTIGGENHLASLFVGVVVCSGVAASFTAARYLVDYNREAMLEAMRPANGAQSAAKSEPKVGA